MSRTLLVAWLVASGAGCAAAPHTEAAGAVSALAVRSVDWDPAHAVVGRVGAVADSGEVVVLFGTEGATVMSAGAVVAVDRRVTDWNAAATIRAADGGAAITMSPWVVGIDARGRLRRLRDLHSFEDVSARYGLEGRRVRGAAMLDPGHVGFLLDGEIAVADGRQVVRCGPVPLSTIAGGAGFGVGVGPGVVVVFDARTLGVRTYALPGATQAAIAADGRVFATTARAVYALSPSGDLALLYDAGVDAIHGLAVSGEEIWFADGSELAVVQGDHVGRTHGATIAPDATLAQAPTGDVWVIAEGKARRVSRADVDTTADWSITLAPIFARSCAACHRPDGPSGVDLSTRKAWQSHRDAIRARVVVDRTMPPDGHLLSDADRAAIRAWARP